ncbi:MAG: hypothetical protein ACXWNK_12770 [Vulcanimicrobiaceae bacterium]
MSTPMIYVEFVGDLTTEGVDAMDHLLSTGTDACSTTKPIAISLKRLKVTRWNAVLALAKRCGFYRKHGRDVVLLGKRSTRLLLMSVEPTLTWIDDRKELSICRHVIVANRARTEAHAAA